MSGKRERAIGKIRSGDTAGGKQLLIEVLKARPQDDVAWVWMSAVVADRDLRQECLEEALKWDPYNLQARRGFDILAHRRRTTAGSNGRKSSSPTDTWSYEAYRQEHPDETLPEPVWQPKKRHAARSPGVLAWIGIGLPLLLLLVGGAIGGAVGAVGARINLSIYRSRASGPAKFVGMLLVTVGAVVAYAILVLLVTVLLLDAAVLR